MGCGDSKLAVATSNAILRKKSNAGDSTKKVKDTGTSPKPIKDCEKNVAIPKGQHQDVKEAAEVIKNDNVGVLEADDAKDINENTKEDEGDKEIIDNEEHEAGRLRMSADSQRDFFSSTKLDDIGIDAIICDGRSGASDYYTPRHGPGNKGNLSFKVEDQENKVVEAEDKELLPAAAAEEEKILLLAAEETKPAVVETTSPLKQNTEEPVVLVKEKMLDETAEDIKVTTVEAKVSSPVASSQADEEDKKETEVEKEKKEIEKEEKKEFEKEEKKELRKEEKEEKEVEEDKKAKKLELK